jgi:hypothetical protein
MEPAGTVVNPWTSRTDINNKILSGQLADIFNKKIDINVLEIYGDEALYGFLFACIRLLLHSVTGRGRLNPRPAAYSRFINEFAQGY